MDLVLAGYVLKPGPTQAQLAAGNRTAPGVGSYDAIRVYLWLGMADRDTPGLKPLLGTMYGMSNYMMKHLTPPLVVDSTGNVTDPNAPPGFSAALVPYLSAVGMKKQMTEQMDRLAVTRIRTNGLYGRDKAYYDQNLALFGTGWAEKRLRFDKDGRLQRELAVEAGKLLPFPVNSLSSADSTKKTVQKHEKAIVFIKIGGGIDHGSPAGSQTLCQL